MGSDYKERFESLKSFRWLRWAAWPRKSRSGPTAGAQVYALDSSNDPHRPRSEESTAVTHPFLDLAPLSAARFASIEDRVARLLSTGQDVVIMQGEALLPLEGAIRGAAGPGTTALNVITGPYGQTFGNWLRDCGAAVVDLAVPFHTAVTAEQVREAFAEHPEIDFVSLVHAEAATGNTNPVAEIGEVVREHGRAVLPGRGRVGRRRAGAAGRVGRGPVRDRGAEGDGRAGRGVGGVGERAGVGADGGEPGGPRAVRTSRSWTGRSAGSTRGRAGAAARPGAAGDAGAGGVRGPDRGGGADDGDGPARGRRGGDPRGGGARWAAGSSRMSRGRGGGARGHDAAAPAGSGVGTGGQRAGRRPDAAAGRGRRARWPRR